MPGNYSIQVRNIDEYTFNKLNEMAEKAGMTREGYLRKMLSNYALSEEIKKVEDKYTTLVKNLVEYIQMQDRVITVRASDTVLKLKSEHFRALTQPPVVCLLSGKTCTMYS